MQMRTVTAGGATLYIQNSSFYSFEYIRRRRLIYASNLSSSAPSLTSKRSRVTCGRAWLLKVVRYYFWITTTHQRLFVHWIFIYFVFPNRFACLRIMRNTPALLFKNIIKTEWRRDQGPLNCDPLCTTLFKHLQPVNNNVNENKPIAFKSKYHMSENKIKKEIGPQQRQICI
jgi:hypothetical protein